jgi:20S proteasome alpha/beta subunit
MNEGKCYEQQGSRAYVSDSEIRKAYEKYCKEDIDEDDANEIAVVFFNAYFDALKKIERQKTLIWQLIQHIDDKAGTDETEHEFIKRIKKEVENQIP